MMSRPSLPVPAKLVASLIYVKDDSAARVLKAMEEAYGPIEFLTEPMPFDYTNYYEKEMGGGLLRYLVSFRELIDPGLLVSVKGFTNQLEKTHSRASGRRMVNIDPGLLNSGSLILATGKYAAHRIYLGEGIFGDLELIFRFRSFRPLDWTYPDYGSSIMINIFNRLRERYLIQLRVGQPH